jgi:hypothetical protein
LARRKEPRIPDAVLDQLGSRRRTEAGFTLSAVSQENRSSTATAAPWPETGAYALIGDESSTGTAQRGVAEARAAITVALPCAA